MNEKELKERLAAWSVPPPEASAKDRALRTALAALRPAPAFQPHPWRLQWRWAAPVLSAAAALFLLLWLTPDRDRTWQASVNNGRRILGETNALFPAQVRAVIFHEGAADLITAESPRRGEGIPLILEFRRGRERLQIVTFSGERLEIKLGREAEPIEVLVDGTGDVLVVGRDFVWSKGLRGTPHGYQVQAQSLGLEL